MVYCNAITRERSFYVETEQYYSHSTEDTENAGAALARKLIEKYHDAPFFVTLSGGLGAGKTAFTRGFASVLSPGSRVKSPSFTIVNEYRRGTTPLFHFDLYRLGESADLSDIGFSEYVENGHCIIEWSEYLNEDIPENAVNVNIEKSSDTDRIITVKYR